MLNFFKKLLCTFADQTKENELSELTLKIFERAFQENASELLFGIPPGEDFDHESNRVFKQEVDEETREFAEAQGLEVKEPENIDLSNIPIFMKINGQWEYVFTLPMVLHTQVIEELKNHSEDFSISSMQVNLEIDSLTVSFTLDTNENFNYMASGLKFIPK